MPDPPHIILTVTNDLIYDQRMDRICTSLAGAGYRVTLIGRELPASLPTEQKDYEQRRIRCRNHAGKLFYLEYNWRLSRELNGIIRQEKKAGRRLALCAIDLDTILPVLRQAKKWKLPRVYDAHELFTELTEVKRRPMIYSIWKQIEKAAVPQFAFGYTVNGFIAEELYKRYGVRYEVIRNMPVASRPASKDSLSVTLPAPPFFLYQGAVNEGRSFETLIPSMKMVPAKLVIAGTGNFYDQARKLAEQHEVLDKVIFLGAIKPVELRQITPRAYAGLTIFENTGLNQYYSLANRYFDYIQAGIPQLCVDYPEYAVLNQQFETGFLINDLSPAGIAAGLNKLLTDTVLYKKLSGNCAVAAEQFCWENEAKRLVAYWSNILPINI